MKARESVIFLATMLGIATLDAPCYGQYFGSSRSSVATVTQARQSIGVRPPRRPVVSPYLDLSRFGSRPSFQLFRRIRPELELRRAFQTNRRGLQRLQRRVGFTEQRLGFLGRRGNLGSTTGRLSSTGGALGQDPSVFVTGHPASFMDLRDYFPGLAE